MSDPLVSVIVPLYNYSQYIGWTIQSVINQTYSNWELIVIDDCSTDDSYRVAKKYECKNIKIMQLSENSGYSKAKNEGIIASQGEYITTLDADDMFTIKSISSRMKRIRTRAAEFVHAMAIVVGGNHSLEDCYGLKKIRRSHPKIHAQTVLMSRNVYKKFGLYDENLRSRSDKEMWWRLFGQGCKSPKIKKVYLKRDVAFYRKHRDSMMVYRGRHKAYNRQVTEALKDAFKMRQRDGITKENTRFLET